MEIVTRKDAMERGEKTFFTGEPCKHGHISKRTVLNRSCCECRAEHTRKSKPWLKESTKKVASEYRKSNPIMGLMERARNRAKVKGIPFTIEYTDVVIPDVCPILGIPLFRNEGGKPSANSPSLDRVIPELGYVPGNICVISHRANTIKNDATAEELLAVIEYIRSFSA